MLRSLKGKSRPLPGFRLVRTDPTPARRRARLAAGGTGLSEAPGPQVAGGAGPARSGASAAPALALAACNLVGTRTLESRGHEEPQVPTMETRRARPHVTLIAHPGGQHGEQLLRRGPCRASHRRSSFPEKSCVPFSLWPLRSTLFPPLSSGDPLSVFPW